MLYRIGIENRNDGFRTAAWGLAHPAELWSLRKMLRRAVWHERGPIEYIRKLV